MDKTAGGKVETDDRMGETRLSEQARERVMLSLIHYSAPTRLLGITYAVYCLKKKKNTNS